VWDSDQVAKVRSRFQKVVCVLAAGETPGQDIHGQDKAELRLPWLSLQPEGPGTGNETMKRFVSRVARLYEQEPGRALRLLPAWGVP
jgi:hypothetical protein